MFIQQLYTNCLSEAAYYIESNGEAAVIDPLRDIDAYLLLAKERNASIKYIFETHFHADFVSGHLELQKATGACIVYGPDAKTGFSITQATDGQMFQLGNINIKVIHTPGHTLESCCYLLYDETNQPHALFTGDTLFVGDVGRPDLSSGNLDQTTLAGMLYESLYKKIISLPDHTIVYPAHGPGSSCGKNLGKETYSTLGEQKQFNYALKAKTKEEFIHAVTTGLTDPPAYFPINARITQEGYESIDTVFKKALHSLSIKDFKKYMDKENTLVLDTRTAIQFTQGFIPSSINIGLEGRFAEWAGSLLPFDAHLLLVAEGDKVQESITRLTRVGFSNFLGYLNGGFDAWKAAEENIDMIIDVEAAELAMDLNYDDNIVLLDVRKEVEYADGHIKGAVNMPLQTMMDPLKLSAIEDDMNVYIYCGGGYRSVVAASLLKRQDIHNIRNILGGWGAIKEQKEISVVKETAALN